MLRNFIKTALRNLAKNGLISFINIFGLSLAIGCSLVVYIMIDYEFASDKFHVNHENIFLVNNVVARDGSEQIWGDSPAPIAEMLKADFPQIKLSVRVDNRSTVFKYEEKTFNESVRFVDPEFLGMFTFPLAYGNKEALKDQSQIIISERISKKYFGENDPIGEQVVLILNDQKESFVIGGVAERFPKTSSFAFDILINFEKKVELNYRNDDHSDWTNFITASFIELQNPEDIEVISSKMDKYVKIQNEVEKDWPAKAYVFEPLSTLSFNSHRIRGDISGGNDPVARMVLSVIGIFMMALACFNYINISISSAAKRLKEIGIRKVIGGSRSQLVWQFMGENLIICTFSLILGYIWARTIFGPWFDNQFSIGLDLDVYKNLRAWIFFTILLLLTGIGSGAYPAFYISSFKAVNIFRGKEKFGTRNVFTKVFLTFQFILSIITIVFGITFTQNAWYQQNLDWGYDQQQTYVVRVNNEQTYTAMRNDFMQHPDVLSVAGSVNHVGRSISLSVVDVNGEKYEIRRIDVGKNYIETLDIRLAEGRIFDEQLQTDVDQSIVVNRQLVKSMGWGNAIGKTFDIDTLTYNIIGVVEDFHYDDFGDEIEPTFFRMRKPEDFNFISVRIKEGQSQKIAEFAEVSFKKYSPDVPYDGFFQNEVFDRYFTQIDGHSKIMSFTATLAVLLSCMGLFGLVSLNVTARMKEFSIRKVLGAGITSLFNGINRQYVWLISIACIIGLPISYVMVSALLEEVYRYHVPLTFTPLVLAAVLLFSVALMTVSSQIYKVVVSNPVDSLRNE